MASRPSEYYKDEEGDFWLLFGTVEDASGARVMLVPVHPRVQMELEDPPTRYVRDRDGLERVHELTITEKL